MPRINSSRLVPGVGKISDGELEVVARLVGEAVISERALEIHVSYAGLHIFSRRVVILSKG